MDLLGVEHNPKIQMYCKDLVRYTQGGCVLLFLLFGFYKDRNPRNFSLCSCYPIFVIFITPRCTFVNLDPCGAKGIYSPNTLSFCPACSIFTSYESFVYLDGSISS